jgi:hypothetical protein
MHLKKTWLSFSLLTFAFFASKPTRLEAMINQNPLAQNLELVTALAPLLSIASAHVHDYEGAKRCALWAQVFRIANESLAFLQSEPMSPAFIYNGSWALRDSYLLYKMGKGHFRKKLSVLTHAEQITAESIAREDIIPILEILLAGYQGYLHREVGNQEEKDIIAALHSWLRWVDYTVFWQSDRKTEQLKIAGLVLHTVLVLYHLKIHKSL